MREALIVIDMCNDFVADNGRLSVGEPAQKIVPFIVSECQKTLDSGDLVIFVVDHHNKGKDGNWPDHCDPNTDGVDLYGKIGEWQKINKHSSLVKYIPKEKYNAFWGTYLASYLKANEIKTVKLCGVCTDICVFGTAAGAYFDGFQIKVLKKGCATLSFLEKNEPIVYDMMKGQFFAEIVE